MSDPYADFSYSQAELNKAIAGYVVCLLWTGVVGDDTDIDLDLIYDLPSTDCDDSVFDNARTEISAIFDDDDNSDILMSYFKYHNFDQFGHDFWLTRNRHGVGFWDRGIGEIGDKLTEISHGYGEVTAYLQNGKVFVE